jgi:proline dehydrogenase
MAILRSGFIALSRNAALRNFSERSTLGKKMSSRFVAGMQIEDVLKAAESLNRAGISATLDSLGENVHTPEEAQAAAGIYHRLLDEIAARKLNANVSVKLTQMGLELDRTLAHSIAAKLVQHAASVDSFVRIDMEGSDLTTVTVDMVRALHREYPGRVGVVIQAYLYRSEADIAALLGDSIRIRLCKGAYQEPPAIAFPAKADVDQNYLKLSKILLTSGVFHGLATHDEEIISEIKQWLREQKIDLASFEFQMLYGVRRDLQKALVEEGFGMRVYIPFGTEWYPYFMRRLAERPANVLFIARQMLRQ